SVDVYAFATDYIDDIIAQIRGLIQKGHAYVAEDGSVYYDTTTFSGWGKLSGQKVESLRPGARIAIEERKRHPADFVLWRAQKPGEPAWDSPWGKGRPGWHIEDTAITIRHFGPQYDLHGGATELLFPHHEAEIAQAESYTGVAPFVQYWMHVGMVMVSGEEMHKSLGTGVDGTELDSVAAAIRTLGDILELFQIPDLATDRFDGVMDLVVRLREDARQRKDFATADRIRHGLAALGIVLEDTRDGIRWKQK